MTKTDFKANQEQELRNEMYIAIKALNKNTTDSHLSTLSTQAVIGQTQPNYREKWQDRFDKINESKS